MALVIRITENHHYEQEQDDCCDEVEMVTSNLDSLAKKSAELKQYVQNGDIEEWVQEKIAVAEYMIDTLYDYYVHSQHHHNEHEHTEHYDNHQMHGMLNNAIMGMIDPNTYNVSVKVP